MKSTVQKHTKSWCGRKTFILHRQNKNLSLLSCFPAALYESLGLAGKNGHQHHTSLLRSCHPCLAAESTRKWRQLKAIGPFWRFSCTMGILASLPLRAFPTTGCGAPFHWCTGLGNRRRNRKAEYWTNVHLIEYKTSLFPTVYCIEQTLLFFLIASGFYVAVKVFHTMDLSACSSTIPRQLG